MPRRTIAALASEQGHGEAVLVTGKDLAGRTYKDYLNDYDRGMYEEGGSRDCSGNPKGQRKISVGKYSFHASRQIQDDYRRPEQKACIYCCFRVSSLELFKNSRQGRCLFNSPQSTETPIRGGSICIRIHFSKSRVSRYTLYMHSFMLCTLMCHRRDPKCLLSYHLPSIFILRMLDLPSGRFRWRSHACTSPLKSH